MALFKRHDQSGVEQATAAPAREKASAQTTAPDPSAKVMPPFVRPVVPPGVVPPAAAPMYSMLPSDGSPHRDDGAESSVATLTAEKVKSANAPQDSVERIQVAVQRTRPAAAAPKRIPSRPAPPPRPVTPKPPVRARVAFDPVRAAQAGLLNLAWSWQQSGAPIRAIHAYLQLLWRYPDTPAADAAVADLVALSEKLASEGQFHIALAIYEHLEQLG